MDKYKNLNVNLRELEEDYGEGILDGYIRTRSYTEKKYIENKYKTFMKQIKGLEEYKIHIVNGCGKYAAYIIPILDMSREDNSVDMRIVQQKIGLSDSQYKRALSVLIENRVLHKHHSNIYINPLLGFAGRDIRLDLGIMFEDQLNIVGMKVK